MPTSKHHLTGPGCFRRLFAWGVAGCFAGLTSNGWAQTDKGKPDANGFIVLSPSREDWTRHFHVGASIGMNIKASFNEQGLFNLSGNNVANGIFDDGYVRVDNTGNADGYTSYWGYNSASQYNAAAQTLTLHGTSSYTTSGGSTVDGDPMIGFDMAYGDDLFYWKHTRIGWELGFDLLPISISDNHPMSATVNQSAYIFKTGGIVMPGAPYQGGSSGQGSLLSGSIPPPSPSGQPPSGMVTGTRTLDVTLYTIRLGPSFYWGLTEKLGLSLSGGPAIGIVSGDYQYNENILTSSGSTHNQGSFGATEVVYGGYVNATLRYFIVDNGRNAYFYIGAQYSPMSDANFSSGGRNGQLNLSGQIDFSAGIGWPF